MYIVKYKSFYAQYLAVVPAIVTASIVPIGSIGSVANVSTSVPGPGVCTGISTGGACRARAQWSSNTEHDHEKYENGDNIEDDTDGCFLLAAATTVVQRKAGKDKGENYTRKEY